MAASNALSTALAREDQTRFWDKQASDYGDANMTNDNGGELAIVGQLCAEFAINAPHCFDVVTFGGADGSRDPRVIMETLASTHLRPQEIYFNDLSPEMVRHARLKYLNGYSDRGIAVLGLTGNVADVVDYIPKVPRRVVIGGYHIEAFLRSSRSEGYPVCGLDEYVRSADKLGTLFTLEWCDIDKTGYDPTGKTYRFDARDTADKEIIKTMVSAFSRSAIVQKPGALRVVARHSEQSEPFVSHWYNDAGFRTLLSAGFGSRVDRASFYRSAKGIVVCIDPESHAPVGMVTMLNNVIGNILPKDVVRNLKAIDLLCQ